MTLDLNAAEMNRISELQTRKNELTQVLNFLTTFNETYQDISTKLDQLQAVVEQRTEPGDARREFVTQARSHINRGMTLSVRIAVRLAGEG